MSCCPQSRTVSMQPPYNIGDDKRNAMFSAEQDRRPKLYAYVTIYVLKHTIADGLPSFTPGAPGLGTHRQIDSGQRWCRSYVSRVATEFVVFVR